MRAEAEVIRSPTWLEGFAMGRNWKKFINSIKGLNFNLGQWEPLKILFLKDVLVAV